MNLGKPVFRIGQSNHYVQPGDFVWSDLLEARMIGLDADPIVTKKPISGRVRTDGTVLLANGIIVPLDQCRLAEKVIRI